MPQVLLDLLEVVAGRHQEARDQLDEWDKFTVPVVANGEVFVAGTSQLTVFGLLP